MSAQTMAEAFAPIEARNREIIKQNTWGHLAPKKNKSYQGRVVYAVGCFGSDNLNPTVIYCEFKGLDSSPWFFDALMNLVQDVNPSLRKEGFVYEWTGTFRNYVFRGAFRGILDSTKK